MKLEKYSFGTGDRFGHQGNSQLQAVRDAKEQGVDIAILACRVYRLQIRRDHGGRHGIALLGAVDGNHPNTVFTVVPDQISHGHNPRKTHADPGPDQPGFVTAHRSSNSSAPAICTRAIPASRCRSDYLFERNAQASRRSSWNVTAPPGSKHHGTYRASRVRLLATACASGFGTPEPLPSGHRRMGGRCGHDGGRPERGLEAEKPCKVGEELKGDGLRREQ